MKIMAIELSILDYRSTTDCSLALTIFICAVLFLAFKSVGRAVRNLYFHPLSKFPGPFFARSTSWWSTYQQVLARQSMHHICEKLHHKHGKNPFGAVDQKLLLNTLQVI